MSAEIKRKMFEIMASGVGHGFGELKKSIMPEKFYKYQSISDYTLDAFQNGYLWLSPVTGLNDPYDSKVGFDEDLDRHEVKKAIHMELTRMAWELGETSEEGFMKLWMSEDLVHDLQALITAKYPDKLADFNRMMQGIVDWVNHHIGIIELFNKNINSNVKICSLSEVNDSLAMWSYYSSDHRGVCLEFPINEFRGPDLVQFYPVNYSLEFLDVGRYLREGMDIIQICLLAGICKHEQWSHEREWRFVRLIIGKGWQLNAPKPTTIFFGSECNFEDDKVKKLIEIADKRGVIKMKMIKDRRKYGLIPIELP